jgi:Fur family ferric uptake transcriptional regulator
LTADTSIDAARALLRERGLQATSARIAVLQILREEHSHRSVEELRARILERYPLIDPATVYRTLETLADHGLAVHMDLGDKRTRWVYATDDHHHLICRNCKQIVELDDAPFQTLAAELNRRHGVQVTAHHLVLHGLCAACAAES